MRKLKERKLTEAVYLLLGWRRGNGFCCNVRPSKRHPGWHHPKCTCQDVEHVDCNCYSNPTNDCDVYYRDCAHAHYDECLRDLNPITESMFLEWLAGFNAKLPPGIRYYAALSMFDQRKCALGLIQRSSGNLLIHVEEATPAECRERAIVVTELQEARQQIKRFKSDGVPVVIIDAKVQSLETRIATSEERLNIAVEALRKYADIRSWHIRETTLLCTHHEAGWEMAKSAIERIASLDGHRPTFSHDQQQASADDPCDICGIAKGLHK